MKRASIPRRVSAPVLVTAFALSACRGSSSATPPEPPAAPVTVESAVVRAIALADTLAVAGSLKGHRQTDLAANAVGRVLETTFDRGNRVEQGAVLARLDVRSAAIAAGEARANARGAALQASATRSECERARGLLQKGALSQQDFDRISAQCASSVEALEAAEARAVLAAKNVGDGVIRAPFAGMVVERHVNAGEYVREDSKVATLVTLDRLRLEMTVPESRFAMLKSKQVVRFAVAAYPARIFEGVVARVGGAVRETTRDVVVDVEVDNRDLSLRPGMFAHGHLLLEERQVPAVPEGAIVVKGREPHLFVVAKGHVEEHAVQTGARKDGFVAVVRGVSVGDEVVVRPAPALRNGQAVK